MMPDKENLEAALYVVATPIGNLEDLSTRAKRILSNVDWIAAEDTRETIKLLNSFHIQQRLESFHEHTNPEKAKALIEAILTGKSGALVCDAGTPLINDPGSVLLQEALARKIKIIPIPGPSSLTTLLSVSGFNMKEGFSFYGFFPRSAGERKQLLVTMQRRGGVAVFLESPHRFLSAMEFLQDHSGEIPLVVGRELTKKFETITYGNVSEIWTKLKDVEPKGEFTLALEFPLANQENQTSLSPTELKRLLEELRALNVSNQGLMLVAQSHGLSRNQAYAATSVK